MSNDKIAKFAKQQRNRYPASIESRVPLMSVLISNQIEAMGQPLDTLYQRVGMDAKHTLVRRIKNGGLTLKDMLLISDHLPIDWNSVISSARIMHDSLQPEAPKAEYQVRAEQADTDKFTELFAGAFGDIEQED